MFPNLFAEMARRDITRGALAEAVGVTPTTMGLKLKGEAPITLAEALQIKRAIDDNLGLEYLFSTEPLLVKEVND